MSVTPTTNMMITRGLAIAAAADPEPITKAFLTLGAKISSMFGPNPYNVPAATKEQIFEAAGQNVNNLFTAGYITDAQRVQALQGLLGQGTNYLQQVISQASGSARTPFVNALNNMTTAINQQIASPPGRLWLTTGTGGGSFTLANARSVYVNQGDWEPGVLSYAAQLDDAIVTDLTANPLTQIGGLLGSVTGDVGSIASMFGLGGSAAGVTQAGAASGGSSSLLLLIAAAWFFFRKKI